MTESVKFYKDKNKVAYITFDLSNEKINKLSFSVLSELNKILDEIKYDNKIKVLIFKSNKKDCFIAGADINEINSLKSNEDAFYLVSDGQSVINKITELNYPTIALINGHALGGGLELALACDYRIATENLTTKIGLPEVTLGIIPGFGGTQRLPLLTGLITALDLIATGRTVGYKKAFKLNIIDDYYPEEFIDEHINNFINTIYLNPKKIRKKRKRKVLNIFLESFPFTKRIIINKALKNIKIKTGNHYPAPIAAVNLLGKTYKKNIKKGLLKEVIEFSKLINSDVFRNLIRLYFVQQKLKDVKYQFNNGKVMLVKRAAVLGAGVMGGAISWLFANNNIPVIMKDVSWDAVFKGLNSAYNIFKTLVKIKKIDKIKAQRKMENINGRIDFNGLGDVDIVVEAIVENLQVKQTVLSEIEKKVNTKTIIASNTSSLTLNDMSKLLKNKSRFVGMHFFNPVNRMPLVEIVYNENTSIDSVVSIFTLAQKIGKFPIIVKDCSGFLVNRILMSYLNEAGKLLTSDYDYRYIDRIVESFGMPMGPFRLLDEIGMDIGIKIANIFQTYYGDRFEVPKVFKLLADQKTFLGKKNNNGFYIYKGKKKKANKKMINFLRSNNMKNFINSYKTKEYILDKLFYTMINESVMTLEEGIVKNAETLDTALLYGIGFPAFRGGILKYADSVGLERIIDKLKHWKLNESQIIISKKLLSMIKNNEKFY